MGPHRNAADVLLNCYHFSVWKTKNLIHVSTRGFQALIFTKCVRLKYYTLDEEAYTILMSQKVKHHVNIELKDLNVLKILFRCCDRKNCILC